MARARLRALSYSADSKAADKKLRTGRVSFSVIDSQNGLSLFDLKETGKYLSNLSNQPWMDLLN